MPATLSTLNDIIKDFPHHTFQKSDVFRWLPKENTIFYIDTEDPAFLLHELAHAVLNHTNYTRDIELIGMERDAWNYAIKTLSPLYAINIVDATVQDSLDTYRDWLHARSTCPQCDATGIQNTKNTYKCLACHTSWSVNEAKSCSLRRYPLT